MTADTEAPMKAVSEFFDELERAMDAMIAERDSLRELLRVEHQMRTDYDRVWNAEAEMKHLDAVRKALEL